MPRSSNKGQEIFEYIKKTILENGYSPSVREIGAAVGLKSPSTVHAHLLKLQEEERIFAIGKKFRTITLAEMPELITTSDNAEIKAGIENVPSDIDARVLAYIRIFISEHRFSPSVREIANALGFKSQSTAFYHLRKLREHGLINMGNGRARSITIVQ